MPSHRHTHTFYLRGKAGRKYRCYIRGEPRLIPGGHCFSGVATALFTFTISGESRTPVLDELYDHTDHVPIRQEPQQLSGEAAVPDSVIFCCQIYEHGTGLLFCLKAVLNVLSEQNNLIYSGFLASKSSLFFREQWVIIFTEKEFAKPFKAFLSKFT